jgi:Fur family ferric uptake transcriptional regulator
MSAEAEAWSELAEARLAQAGFRRGGARAAVIELLDDQSCEL